MDATPPPELANHEERITKLENAMTNFSCELQVLQSHMDARLKEIEASINILRIELRAEFKSQLHEAVEKLNARMDSHSRWIIGTQFAILLAIVALIANS